MHALRISAIAGLAALGLAAAHQMSASRATPLEDAAPAMPVDVSHAPATPSPIGASPDAPALERPRPRTSRSVVVEGPSTPAPASQGDAGARGRDVVLARATTLAGRLGLSAPQEEALRDVLVQEQRRREAVLAGLRADPDSAAVNALARDQLTAILNWKAEELRTRLGAELAGKVLQRR